MSSRLIQIFLTGRSERPGPAIFEVHSNENKDLTCNCPGFESKGRCRHTKLVMERIDANNGLYPFDFSDEVTVEQIKDAMKTEKDFRELIIHHAKIEVY
jgi:hypothetical protein